MFRGLPDDPNRVQGLRQRVPAGDRAEEPDQRGRGPAARIGAGQGLQAPPSRHVLGRDMQAGERLLGQFSHGMDRLWVVPELVTFGAVVSGLIGFNETRPESRQHAFTVSSAGLLLGGAPAALRAYANFKGLYAAVEADRSPLAADLSRVLRAALELADAQDFRQPMAYATLNRDLPSLLASLTALASDSADERDLAITSLAAQNHGGQVTPMTTIALANHLNTESFQRPLDGPDAVPVALALLRDLEAARDSQGRLASFPLLPEPLDGLHLHAQIVQDARRLIEEEDANLRQPSAQRTVEFWHDVSRLARGLPPETMAQQEPAQLVLNAARQATLQRGPEHLVAGLTLGHPQAQAIAQVVQCIAAVCPAPDGALALARPPASVGLPRFIDLLAQVGHPSLDEAMNAVRFLVENPDFGPLHGSLGAAEYGRADPEAREQAFGRALAIVESIGSRWADADMGEEDDPPPPVPAELQGIELNQGQLVVASQHLMALHQNVGGLAVMSLWQDVVRLTHGIPQLGAIEASEQALAVDAVRFPFQASTRP